MFSATYLRTYFKKGFDEATVQTFYPPLLKIRNSQSLLPLPGGDVQLAGRVQRGWMHSTEIEKQFERR
jgi:hypothetical protein